MIDWIKAKWAILREKSKGYKTIIVGLILGVPQVLLQILEALSLIDLATVLPEPWASRLSLATAIIMILMRFTVTGPVGAKGDEQPDPDVKAGD